MGRIYYPTRHTAVPWLEDSDLYPMGDPETRIEIGDDNLTLGLRIVTPFGVGTDAMLAVHAVEDAATPGGAITLAITTTVEVETPAPMEIRLLSNPRRPDADTGED